MTRYTEVKLTNSIESIQKLLDLEQERKGKMIELQRTLIRIRRAIKPKFWLQDELQKEKQKLAKTNPNEHKLYGFQSLTRQAKINIIKREKYLYSLRNDHNIPWDQHSTNGMKWDDFKFFLEKQYEHDREKLIKEGEI